MSGTTKVAITESADELKEQMNKQFRARDRERLQALYLLKSGKCQQIVEIAELIGRSRSTIHHSPCYRPWARTRSLISQNHLLSKALFTQAPGLK
ncbi:MAG: helix-turn-helix domain-containing protein [Pleurocapsa sp.]